VADGPLGWWRLLADRVCDPPWNRPPLRFREARATPAHLLVDGFFHADQELDDPWASPGDRLSLGVRPGGVHLFAADDEGRRLH
jgi:hypothetical protein